LPEKHFDGVFGNAALFHAPMQELPSVLLELHATPKPRRRHDLGISTRHERGRWKNNRAENSHQPIRRRERKMHPRAWAQLKRFLSAHAAVRNIFNVQRHLWSAERPRTLRAAAMNTWRAAVVAARNS